jgi:hypothetical protein
MKRWLLLLLFALSADAGLVTQSGPRLFVEDEPPAGTEFAHGDLVEIEGSGFPSEPTTILFAGGANGPLETTTTGQTPDQGNNQESASTTIGFNWTRYLSTETPAVIVSDGTRGKVLGKTHSGDGETSQEARFSSGVGLNGRVMVKYYFRFDGTEDFGQSPQFKLGTVQAGLSDVADAGCSSVKFTYNSGQAYAYQSPSSCATGAETWALPGGSNEPEPDGNWHRFDIKIVAPSAQGASNGQIWYRATENAVASYVSDTGNNLGIQMSAVNLYPNSLRYTAYFWQNWNGNGFTNGTYAVDDHYVSVGSFASVELWNSCTPASATLREMQEPTSWSSSSITVRLNRGGLSNGTYYLVVLDDAVADTVLECMEIELVSFVDDVPGALFADRRMAA